MPNFIAYIALLIWPVVSVVMYHRLPVLSATLGTIVVGFMLLPSGVAFDLPLIPALDKQSIPILCSLFSCIFIKKNKIFFLPKQKLERAIVFLMVVMPFITVLNNSEPYGTIPGLKIYDAVSAIVEEYIGIIPFLIGLSIVKNKTDILTIYRWLIISALFYSIPALLEIRISPQLHNWIYGFHAQSFLQQVRAGGYRPVVFMGHGLILALYFSVSIMCLLQIIKSKTLLIKNSTSKINVVALMYLLIVLMLCKSLGSILFVLLFSSIVLISNITLIRTMVVLISILILIYPLMALSNIFPYEEILNFVKLLSSDRARSLGVRFFNEQVLLHHAVEKFFFGWGQWGRNRLPGTISDGYWVIITGVYGLVGFLLFFGLLIKTVFTGLKASKLLIQKNEINFIAGFSLLLTLLILDQIVNASISSWIWFLFGSLSGLSHNMLENDALLKDSVTSNVEPVSRISSD